MTDTTIFGNTITGSFKAMMLYVVADACVSLGQSFSSMDHGQWNSMWWLQKLGFALSQVGSTALMIKAFYSGSSPRPPAVTTNLTT